MDGIARGVWIASLSEEQQQYNVALGLVVVTMGFQGCMTHEIPAAKKGTRLLSSGMGVSPRAR